MHYWAPGQGTASDKAGLDYPESLTWESGQHHSRVSDALGSVPIQPLVFIINLVIAHGESHAPSTFLITEPSIPHPHTHSYLSLDK